MGDELTAGTRKVDSLAFSVVIPTFDRPHLLRASLESLVGQRFPRDRFEVIVVDDGGTVPAQAVAEAYMGQLSLTVCRQSQAGPSAARNAGAERARAPYIAFLDDDCRADPAWLHELEAR